jgi:colicin import membrane protein
MWQILKRNPLAAVIAVLMHLAILGFMLVGVDWLEKPRPVKVKVDVVQARVIDNEKVMAEVERLKQTEEKQRADKEAARQKEEQRLADLKRKQAEEKQRLDDLEKKRKAEEQKRQQAKQQRLAEEKRHREAEEKRKAEQEAKRRAEEKRQAELEANRKAEEKRQAELEKKRRAEAKRKAEQEAKRQAELEKKRKAEAERKAREAELQAAMEAEANAREVDRYIIQIKQKVVRNWLRPAGISDGLKCTLRVRLAPGGNVIAVSVLQGSGNGAFDRSATAAVYKAEPLPVPAGGLFESFRDINFEFDPSR